MAFTVSSTTSLPQPPRMRYPSTRSRSPVCVESQVSILMAPLESGQLLQLASLREIANHQLQIFGLLQHVVAAGGLIAVGDDVARQRGQHVVGASFGRKSGHAREGTQRPGDGDDLRLRAGSGGERRKTEVGTTGGAVLLHVTLGGIPIARQQIQDHHAAGGQLALLAASGVPYFFVHFTRRRIAVPIQKLRIGQPGVRRARLRRVLQVIARFGRVAFAFHLPGASREIVGRPRPHQYKIPQEK